MSDSHLELPTPPKRRFLDRQTNTPTLVGLGTRMQGELQCSGDLSVSGEVLGSAHVKGMLTLAETGAWQGDAHCAHALLAGKFEGDLVVTGKLEVRSSAHVKGQITAQQIAIAEGAILEADVNVASDAPVQRFEEKRLT